MLSDKKTAVDLVEARITKLEQDLLEQHKLAIKTKNKYEELEEKFKNEEFKKLEKKTLQELQARLQEHAKANARAIFETDRIKDKIEENKEMLKILQGGQTTGGDQGGPEDDGDAGDE